MSQELASLRIAPELIETLVTKHIQQAVGEALIKPEGMIRECVHRIMNMSVDSHGKVSSYQSENKFRLFDVLLRKELEIAIQAGIREALAKETEEIRHLMFAAIEGAKSKLADSMISAVTKAAASAYSFKVEVHVGQKG